MEEILETLHQEVAIKLLDQIQSGEAVASDFNQAINFLKLNGINAVSTKGSTLDKINKSICEKILPFPSSNRG